MANRRIKKKLQGSQPTKRMEQYRLQHQLFQQGSYDDDGEQPWEASDEENPDKEPWDTRMESQDMMPEVETAPEVEETANKEDWRILKDNQLWEKQDNTKEGSQDIDNGEKAQADGTIERGLGPTDTLV